MRIIGENSSKKHYFSLEERKQHLEAVFAGHDKVNVTSYSGLTIDFCKSIGATYLIRGLRDGKDFEYRKVLQS